MADIYKQVIGHHNFYVNLVGGSSLERKFDLYMYEPDMGINEDTGILLFITGFGAHSNNNVYKKMRREFANKYNLLTVQCDYFGWEFMQSEVKEETVYNFCDMSFLQTMDNIYATLYAIDYALSKNKKINMKKIIIYGDSHGAYLAHLCNLYSGIYTHILDNSSWIYPVYLIGYRNITINGIDKNFKYMAREFIGNTKLIDIGFLYTYLENNCCIKLYHGIDDTLVLFEDKERVFGDGKVNFAEIIKISQPDNEVFFSTEHSLDVNYLKLFDLFYNSVSFEKGDKINIVDAIIFENDGLILKIDYTNLFPVLNFINVNDK
ncbi:hypothetical protein [uncultured Tyzzerella sp.]|uniref:hypothetical protein n=1 Tax=uncultured Tyzzerella sp. TaxID=2321398 RepID=UPI002942C54D|nr:hypothetical protein [uncultured Tyzzerella sp.]